MIINERTSNVNSKMGKIGIKSNENRGANMRVCFTFDKNKHYEHTMLFDE